MLTLPWAAPTAQAPSTQSPTPANAFHRSRKRERRQNKPSLTLPAPTEIVYMGLVSQLAQDGRQGEVEPHPFASCPRCTSFLFPFIHRRILHPRSWSPDRVAAGSRRVGSRSHDRRWFSAVIVVPQASHLTVTSHARRSSRLLTEQQVTSRCVHVSKHYRSIRCVESHQRLVRREPAATPPKRGNTR